MPRTINPIKKARVKELLLHGKSARQALKDANYMYTTAHKSTSNKVVKVCIKEILEEIDKKNLVERAYKTLDRNLDCKQSSTQVTAAQAILKFTEGERQRVETVDITEKLQTARERLLNVNPN